MNPKPRAVISGMGCYWPPNIITNEFFESLDIGSSAEWIDERVGIKQRHSVMTPETIRFLRTGVIGVADLYRENRMMAIGDMSIESWQLAKQRAGAQGMTTAPDSTEKKSRSIYCDQLIVGTSVPDWDIPANACAVAHALDLQCTAFDVNSACSSFVVNLHVTRLMIESGAIKCGGIINPERYSTRLNYTDRSSCVLFGDGAAAAIVEADGPGGFEVIDTLVHSNPGGNQFVRIPTHGLFHQDGRAVQKFAVRKTIAASLEVLERNKLAREDIAYFVGHQANLRMLQSACAKQGISEDRHLFNVDMRGNQGAAGAPNVLAENWDKFKKDDLVLVSVVGSGLTWGAALLKWK